MKDIDNNISYTSNFKILKENTNSNKIKIKNENIIVKKIFHSNNNQIKINKIKNPTSPTYFSNTSRNINLNKLIRPITKLNSLNNNESNIIEISALEKNIINYLIQMIIKFLLQEIFLQKEIILH